MQMRFIIFGVVLAALVIGGLVWMQRAPPDVPEEVAPVAAPEPPPGLEPERTGPEPLVSDPGAELPPEAALPALNDSDEFVRENLLESAPALGGWLTQDELVRRFAVILDNAGRGEYPRRQLTYLAPSGPFAVRRTEDQVFVDPAGFARYDEFTNAVTSLDPGAAGALLLTLGPLLTEALGELGLKDGDPRSLLVRGIEQALVTPVLDGDIELVQTNVLYEYADPALEALSPLQKQLLRMGPANLERLQDYLRALRSELIGLR